MNFKEIRVGLTQEFEVFIDKYLVNRFADISGDFNPLHMDEDYAKKTTYGKRVVHGMLLSSLFSRLVGMHLPGDRALYLQQSLKFKNPAFIGDTVTVKGSVTSISKDLRIITLDTFILNLEGKVLLEGEAKVLFRSD